MKPISVLTILTLTLAAGSQAAPRSAESPPAGPTPTNPPPLRLEVAEETRATSDQPARAWLGVAVEEAPEALAAQLGLDPGLGLVVTHVSPDSPAAKAGLRKHDLLTALAGHPLSHPGQLRRLVQAREPGQTIELVFYRGGKRQSASVTLAQAPPMSEGPAESGPWRDFFRGMDWTESLRDFTRQLREQGRRFSGETGEPVQRELKRSLDDARQALQEAARQMRQAQPDLRRQIERSLEQARKALEEAGRHLSNAAPTLRGSAGSLRELLKDGLQLDPNASVVVRSRDSTVRSIVKSDDWGTIVVTGPPLRLTARDRTGRLVFEGEIETPEQRAKVPPEVWQRVEPLLDAPPPKRGPAPARPVPPAPKRGEAL